MTRATVDPTNMWLRPVYDTDHAWLVELHNDPQVLHNLTHPHPITMLQHLTWWSKVQHDKRQLRMVFEVGNQHVGFTKFYDIDYANHCCVLGADIDKDFRGKGLAKYMWTLMLDHCFGELGLHRVGLTTAEYNHVGHRVYRGLGFKDEGRLTQSLCRDGKFYDQLLMYMLRDEWRAQDT